MNKIFKKISTLLSAVRAYRSWPLWALYRFGYNPHKEILFEVRSGEKFFLRIDQGELSPIDSVFRDQSYNRYFPVASDDVVVDIGANIGLYTVYAARRARQGKVYAYDPNPDAVKRLQKNISLNALDNVVVVPKAVTTDGRNVNLYRHSVGTVMATILSAGKDESREHILVETVSLEQVINSSNCTLLKIDCEGAEYELFEKLSTDVLKKVKKIVCEYHWQGYEMIRKKLQQAGFQTYVEETVPLKSRCGTIYGIKKP